MNAFLLCLIAILTLNQWVQGNVAPVMQDFEEEKEQPPEPGKPWDKKTHVPRDTTYADMPTDLQKLADEIWEADKIYRDPKKGGIARCKAFNTMQENIVPLLVSFYLRHEFVVIGPNQQAAAIILQRGFYIANYNSVWIHYAKCLMGRAATLIHPDRFRPLVPLFRN